MNYKEKVLSYPKSKIFEEELMKLLGLKYNEYDKYYKIVSMLIEEGVLKGVKSLGFNGRRDPMYKKFHILKETIDYSKARQEIKTLYFDFDTSYYYKNPRKYLEHKKYIDRLNNFYVSHKDQLKYPASINERSYQIFHEEKLLKSKESIIKTIFKNLGLDYNDLNIYNTPEPFFYHMVNKEYENVLIVENKDTWYTLKKVLNQKKSICNVLTSAIIYGEGNKILDSFEYVKEADYFKDKKLKYIYMGDIDYKGIDIFQKLKRKYEDYKIDIFTPIYEEMILRSKNFNLGTMKEGQKKIDISLFLEYFSKGYQEQIVKILEMRKYIPQEILNYRYFLNSDGEINV
ncbi:Wadjet anti-phage system protein JetD domain-containing protein [Defluviitalea phaphyphila]|uniref:Wadjet anti-phage system protein JetD domain-containing protein n=1 Tax=Defluviitalea phaphyphila TaxID=1473580 RepID=UPI0007315E21|nr:Wadjet anti-phage system protein JetD domain-containing protein [Defluviitalea phaphyphila]